MKKITLLLFICLFAANVFGQQGHRGEKVKALKIAFITEQLDLSSEEASQFWPIYNKYEEKINDIRKKERKEIIQVLRNNFETITDAEANKLIDKSISFREQQRTFETQMINELRVAISPKKVIQLKRVEDAFKRKLLERFKEHRRKN